MTCTKKEILLQPWKSYNCYNAAVGTVLTAAGYPFVALALNSSWDFYLDRLNPGDISMAGVFNATEHPAVGINLARIYDLELKEYACPDWGSWLALLSDKLKKGGLPMVRLKNRFCEYIPKVERTGVLDHYLIATSLDEDRLCFFDSFLNHYGQFPLSRLKEIQESAMEPGEGRYFKTWILTGLTGEDYRYVGGGGAGCDAGPVGRWAMSDAASGAVVDSGSGGIRRMVNDVFFSSLPEGAFGERNERRISRNEEAIKELGDLLAGALPGGFGESALQCLSESLRYVQYQRKYFISSLEEIGSYFPGCRDEAAAISGRVNAISDDWFRLRLTILYNLRKGITDRGGALVKELADGLYAISGKERAIRSGIGLFKERFMNASVSAML